MKREIIKIEICNGQLKVLSGEIKPDWLYEFVDSSAYDKAVQLIQYCAKRTTDKVEVEDLSNQLLKELGEL